MWLKRPVYRGFSGEGKCEGKLSPLTLPSHSPHTLVPSLFRQKAYCLLMILWMGVRFNRQGANKAAVYRECRYAALLVAGMLPLWCRYAATLVQVCCHFGIPMLD